jgi:DNA repair protein SbcC/Rad50
MRPVRLEMAGFGAFREPTVIDFSDVDYLALVGPTGSGKSTVIDAMCFALYGSVPRYAHQGRVGYVVTSGAAEARVSFTFDAGGRRYTAARVVRRKPDGKAVTREARLEVADAEDPEQTEVLAGTVTELDAAIAGPVLGMPFDHFTRCVVLPQGEFARFLSDKPRDRQDMLVSLLGLELYGRMGKRANETASQKEWEAGQLRAQIADRAGATPEAAAALEDRLGRLEKLGDHLGEVRGEVEALEAQSRDAARRVAGAASLAATLEAVQVPAGLETTAGRLAGCRAALEVAEGKRIEAEQASAAAHAAVVAADQASTEAGERAPLEALLVRHQQAAQLGTELDAARKALTAAVSAAEAARRAADAAEEARREADERLLAARAAKAAHTLAERLVPGEPCPVCQVEVERLPAHPPAPDLLAGKQVLDEAAARAREAERAATEADRARVARQTTVDGLAAQLEALSGELAGQPGPDEITATLAGIDTARAAADEARRREAAARQAEAAARREVETAHQAVKAAEGALTELQLTFDRTRDAVAQAAAAAGASAVDPARDAVAQAAAAAGANAVNPTGGAAAETSIAAGAFAVDPAGGAAAETSAAALLPPTPGRVDLAADWAELAAWAGEAAARQRAAERAASAEVDRLRRAAADLLAAATAAFREAGVDLPSMARRGDGSGWASPGSDGWKAGTPAAEAAGGSAVLEAMSVAVARAEAETAAKLARVREMMAEAERLAKQAAAADSEATVARALARHLSAKGFERWVLAEVLDGLVAGASVILHDLSSGAYSLAVEDDGEFSVIDHRNADERRSAKTLSGGETFQASLALALALAEQLSSLAAAGAARIEATFIDEGFGTLDEETLETVAATIEALGGDDRLVGVVTHVPALAERVPVRLEVAKGSRTATVTKVVA